MDIEKAAKELQTIMDECLMGRNNHKKCKCDPTDHITNAFLQIKAETVLSSIEMDKKEILAAQDDMAERCAKLADKEIDGLIPPEFRHIADEIRALKSNPEVKP